MKEEIKEILDKLRSNDYYEKEYQKSVYYERDLKKLEDYITNYQLLLDYIANLQEENERLKKENMKLHIQLEDRAYEQIKFLYKDYKSRIDKAIEYIELKRGKNKSSYDCKIINILQGEE